MQWPLCLFKGRVNEGCSLPTKVTWFADRASATGGPARISSEWRPHDSILIFYHNCSVFFFLKKGPIHFCAGTTYACTREKERTSTGGGEEEEGKVEFT